MPHAGTWIEIPLAMHQKSRAGVVPHAGTWIEIKTVTTTMVPTTSCLTQARGLKYIHRGYRMLTRMSCLTQARGLKFPDACERLPHRAVVPHAGTWIEIDGPGGVARYPGGRASRRHVD